MKPRDATDYNIEGVEKSHQKKYQEALECFTAAIQLDPQNSLSHYNYGGTQNKLRNDKKAVEAFDLAIKLDPKFALAYNRRGSSKFNLGHYKESIEDIIQALKIEPRHKLAGNNLFNKLSKATDEDFDKLDINTKDIILSAIKQLQNVKNKEELLIKWFDNSSPLGRFTLKAKHATGCKISKGTTKEAWDEARKILGSPPTFFNDDSARRNNYVDLMLDDKVDEERNHGYRL